MLAIVVKELLLIIYVFFVLIVLFLFLSFFCLLLFTLAYFSSRLPFIWFFNWLKSNVSNCGRGLAFHSQFFNSLAFTFIFFNCFAFHFLFLVVFVVSFSFIIFYFMSYTMLFIIFYFIIFGMSSSNRNGARFCWHRCCFKGDTWR